MAGQNPTAGQLTNRHVLLTKLEAARPDWVPVWTCPGETLVQVADFWLRPHMEEGVRAPWGLFYKDTNPLTGAPP